MSTEQKDQKNPFQQTLNLPKTEFSIRANASQKEPDLLQRNAAGRAKAVNAAEADGDASGECACGIEPKLEVVDGRITAEGDIPSGEL